jgi:hypothetical protein
VKSYPVRTRSAATAAHLSLATGIVPEVEMESANVVVFVFPHEHVRVLRPFLKMKETMLELAEAAGAGR